VSCLPLVVEIGKLFEDSLHLLDGGYEVSDSEVVGAGFLLEATAWHCHDSGLVYQVHAVHKVGLAALGVGFLDELIGEVDSRETVHRTFDLSARNILHRAERRAQKAGLFSEILVELSMFGLVESNGLVGLHTIRWGVHHQFASSLADSV